jgi:hypothetical protein
MKYCIKDIERHPDESIESLVNKLQELTNETIKSGGGVKLVKFQWSIDSVGPDNPFGVLRTISVS